MMMGMIRKVGTSEIGKKIGKDEDILNKVNHIKHEIINNHSYIIIPLPLPLSLSLPLPQKLAVIGSWTQDYPGLNWQVTGYPGTNNHLPKHKQSSLPMTNKLNVP